jgi:hypothetical protein
MRSAIPSEGRGRGSILPSVAILAAAFQAFAGFSGSYSLGSGTKSVSDTAITASSTDVSGVYVTGGATLALSSSSVTTSSATTSVDSSNFYGLDAGVLAVGLSSSSSGTITLTDDKITTTGSGANGVFAYGPYAKVTLKRDTIVCSGSASHGVDATDTGVLVLDSVVITTSGNRASAAISTDRGTGIITGTNLKAKTTGTGSPAIYSTGTITVSNSLLEGDTSEAVVIEGLNTVTLINDSLIGKGPDSAGGAFVYQSASGDAATGTATLTVSGGSFTATKGPLIFVSNTDAKISLRSGVEVSTATGVLMKCSHSAWGTSGSNGGVATTTIDSSTSLSGGFVVDSISSLNLSITHSSSLSGYIDTVGKGTVALTLDSLSTWTATKTSYVDTITDPLIDSTTSIASNIVGKGYNVYYKAWKSGSSSGTSGVFSLAGSGCLMPVGSTSSCTTTGIESSVAVGVPGRARLEGGAIAVEFTGAASVRASVFDLQGRELVRSSVASSSLRIPVAGLSGRGVLFCEGRSDDGRVVRERFALP